ncbi:hypothetical protein H1R20_g829, partial [Candolleomyces eurysporus]
MPVISGALCLERLELKEIISSSEVNQVILDLLGDLVKNLYECHYDKFFVALAELEQSVLVPSRVLGVHARWVRASSFLLPLSSATLLVHSATSLVLVPRDRLPFACRYYVREMRILAYTQLLESYRSLTLDSLARAFGVSVEFINSELSRFISTSRLHAQIDRVNGIVETTRPSLRTMQYEVVVKQG